MKRKILLGLLIVGTVVLCVGCGKDPLSQDTIDKINALGEITIEDQAQIESLEKTYSEMTEKQKNQVKNYIDLKNAREQLNQLIDDEREKMESDPKIACAVKAAEYLKAQLNSPISFELNGMEFMEPAGLGSCVYLVDYSGENKMGGKVRMNAIVFCGKSDESIVGYVEDTNNTKCLYYKAVEGYEVYKKTNKTENIDVKYIVSLMK